MSIPGPCGVCGATNYNLSVGGPGICPRCDCGPPSAKDIRRAEHEKGQALTALWCLTVAIQDAIAEKSWDSDRLTYHLARSLELLEQLVPQLPALSVFPQPSDTHTPPSQAEPSTP